jgi:hypothetical protein
MNRKMNILVVPSVHCTVLYCEYCDYLLYSSSVMQLVCCVVDKLGVGILNVLVLVTLKCDPLIHLVHDAPNNCLNCHACKAPNFCFGQYVIVPVAYCTGNGGFYG